MPDGPDDALTPPPDDGPTPAGIDDVGATDATDATSESADLAPVTGEDAGASQGSSDDEVLIEAIGAAVAAAPSAAPATLLTTTLPDVASRRLRESARFTVINDIERAGEADLVLVSTRLPRTEVRDFLNGLQRTSDAPVVALVHAGGELLAAEVMRSGGTGVIAEGNENALAAFLTETEHDSSLLASYEKLIAPSRGRADPRHDRDLTTHLPGGTAFAQRLSELGQTVGSPRVALLRLLNLDELSHRISSDAVTLLRRRLAVQFRHLAQLYEVELFSLSNSDFALIGPALSPNRAEELGTRMARIAETFAPTGGYTLALAMGHAGPELSQDAKTLRDLAQRALEAAATGEDSGVVSAESLPDDGSSTTELETARRILTLVEQHGPFPPGHGERVAATVGALARYLGYEAAVLTRLMLAAHLHDVGRIGLPSDAMRGPHGLSGGTLEAYQAHPARGAAYLRVSAGTEVAETIRSHREWFDGSGFPDGLREEEIPIGARLIAVAVAYEELRHGVGEQGLPPMPPAEAATALRAMSGSRLDPDLVEAVTTLLPALAHESPARAAS